MDEKEKLRVFASRVRDGELPGPKAFQWMQDTAKKHDLHFPTLIGEGTGAGLGGIMEGATFGFRDELQGAAAALAPGGQNYEEARDAARQRAKTQQFMEPGKYLAGEIGGGVAAGLVPFAGLAGRAAQGGRALSAGRAALLGAGEGALAGYGAQEGTNSPLTGETIIGGLTGAAGGAAGTLAGRALSNVFATGSTRAQRAAQQEIARLVEKTGMTPDEVIEGIAEGSLATQHKTLQMGAKAAYNSAGDAARREAYDVTADQAARGRAAVMDNLMDQTPYDDVSAPGVRAATEVPDANAQYAQAFDVGAQQIEAEGVSDAILDQVERMASTRPQQIANLINENAAALWREAGNDPNAFKPIAKVTDGKFTWNRQPTLEDLATINKSMRDSVSSMYKTTDAVPTEARRVLDSEQRAFRNMLGEEFPDWGNVQRQVAGAKGVEDGYKAAQQGVASPNKAAEFMDTFRRWNPDDELDAGKIEGAKAAVIEKVRQQLSGGRNANPLRSKLGEGVSEGLDPHMAALVRELFPGEDLQTLIRRGADAQELFNTLDTGSPTAELQALMQPYQSSGRAQEFFANAAADGAMGNQAGLIERAVRPAVNFISRQFGVGEEMAGEVLRVLTTNDPDVVRRAMAGDPEAVMRIQRLLTSMGGAAGAMGATQSTLPMLQ